MDHIRKKSLLLAQLTLCIFSASSIASESMDPETAYRFVERKSELVSERMRPDIGAGLRDYISKMTAELRSSGKFKMRYARELEEFLETAAMLADIDWTEVKHVLEEEFGASRLGISHETVVRRILKRGRIKTEKEEKFVKDFVDNQLNEIVYGTETYEKLASIYEDWDGVVERDDKKANRGSATRLAKSRGAARAQSASDGEGVPVERTKNREELEFLDAKFTLISHSLSGFVKREFTASIHTDVKWALAGKRKLSASLIRLQEARVHEFFPDEKSVPWTAINEELQRRFGFSRLGETPVAVARRVLEKGCIDGPEELQHIQLFLSGTRYKEEFGGENFKRLTSIYETWTAERPKPDSPGDSQNK